MRKVFVVRDYTKVIMAFDVKEDAEEMAESLGDTYSVHEVMHVPASPSVTYRQIQRDGE